MSFLYDHSQLNYIFELLINSYFNIKSIRHCRILEEGIFRGRTADYFFMLIFGASLMLVWPFYMIFYKLKISNSYFILDYWIYIPSFQASATYSNFWSFFNFDDCLCLGKI